MAAPIPKPGTELNFKRPMPHQGHRRVRAEMKGKNTVYICAHRGWQKSTFIIDDMLDYLETGMNCGMYAQNYKPLNNNFQEMRKCLFPEEYFNKTEKTFSLPGAGTCFQYTLENPDAARGPTYGKVYCEEAGAWDDGVRSSVVYPVARKCGGQIIETGTFSPANPKNDFYNKLHNAYKYPEFQYAKIIPALGATYNQDTGELEFPPTLDPYCNPKPFPQPGQPQLETYEMQKRMMQMEFEQETNKIKFRIEWLCEPLTDEGGQFDNISSVCNVKCKWLEAAPGIWEWWDEDYLKESRRSDAWFQTGVDVGTKHNYTVVATMDRNTMRQVYMRRFLPSGVKRWDEVKASIVRAKDLFGTLPIVDCTGAGDLEEEYFLEKHIWTSKNKAPIYDHLTALMGGNKIHLFDENQTKKELDQVNRKARASGIFDISAPIDDDGSHADIPAALVLMAKDVPAKEDSVLAGDILDLKPVASQWDTVFSASQW